MPSVSRVSGGNGLAALAKRLSYVASGHHRAEATQAGSVPLASAVKSFTGAHVKTGRLASSAVVVVEGERILLKAEYDAAALSKKPRTSKKTGKILAARKGGGPAVYMKFKGPHGGPGWKGFARVQIAAAREAYIAVLKRAILGS